MSSNPSMSGTLAHRWGAHLKYDTSGSEIWADRVQRVEPTLDIPSRLHYELGTVGSTGIAQDPVSFRFVLEENMHNCEVDYLLAGKNPAPAGAQTYNLGDLLGKDITATLLGRNDAGTLDRELYLTGLRITDVTHNFSVRDAISTVWTLQGRVGRWYTSGSLIHAAWGTADTTSPGGVHGKEAQIWFNTSGSTPTTRVFRLQSFTIRTTFPVTPVTELGNRSVVGQNSDSPETTIDFDVLSVDHQPLDVLFSTVGGYYDLNAPASLFDVYVRVFDPDQAEGASVIKSFKLENCRVVSGTPTRSAVRGLATMRYSLQIAKETTASSGGMVVSNQNQ